jgi:putative endonuclease
MSRQYYVYILTNHTRSVLYVGVTNDLKRRVYEHKNKIAGGFSRTYNLNQLVYYEVYDDIYEAIKREKAIKGGSRVRKMKLVDGMNPDWGDLYNQI